MAARPVRFVVTVPKAIQFLAAANDPTQVTPADVFNYDIVAADTSGNPAAGYSGLVLVMLTDPSGANVNSSYWVGSDQHSHLILQGLSLPTVGQYQLRVSDGIVSNTFSIQVAAQQPAPGVTGATTTENTQTTSGLVITPNAADTTGHQLPDHEHHGRYAVPERRHDRDCQRHVHTVAQGAAGLKFTPTTGSTASGSFTVQESTSAIAGGLGGTTATATITVNAPTCSRPA